MSRNKDLDLFMIDISEEDIAEAFSDEQWEEDVANAAFLGAVYLAGKTNKNPENLINDIVTYNINKRLRKLFVSKSKPLPKKITWTRFTSIMDAFYLLENYIAQVVILKEAELFDKPIKLELEINDNIELQDKISQWCEKFQKKYSSIKITLKSKSKTNYNLTFKDK